MLNVLSIVTYQNAPACLDTGETHMIFVDRLNVCQTLNVQTTRLAEMKNVLIRVIVLQTLFVLLAIIEDIVHVLQDTLEIHTMVDAEKVRKYELLSHYRCF